MLQDFLAGRPSIASDRTASAGSAAQETGFQSLLSARVASLSPGGSARRIESQDAGERLEAPQIELVQEGGVVRRIVVTCTCCQRIELECEY